MSVTDRAPKLALNSTTLLLALALFKLLLHFLTNGQYGYFRDELYYMACGEHLGWGYVDHPPLIAFVTAFTRWILVDSLFALRFFPALSGAIPVFLTGLIVRELGGDLFAQVLAALAVIIAPAYLLTHTLLTMNAFEPLFWTLAAYFLLLSLKKDNPRYWIAIGLVGGIGLMNKHTMAFFLLALVAALLVTPHRKIFLSRWPWLAGILALIIFLPNLLWQFKNDFATLEFLRNAEMQKNLPVSPIEFFLQQILLLHPLLFPLWLTGLYYYLLSREGRAFRLLAWIYVLLFLLLIVMKAKAYYLAPAYPILFASGAVAVEKFLRAVKWSWLRPAVITVGERVEGVKESFHDVELAAIIVSDYVMPYENNLPVCIGRGMKRALKEIWRDTKKFI